MTEDRELLRRYARDDCEKAFAEFVHRHIGVVHHAALRRLNGNTHLAEDAAQIVFSDVARKAGALARHPALVGWLHTSTRYAALVLARSENRRRARERAAHTMDPDSTPAETLPWETLGPLIDGELDRLGETDRQAVLLRFFSGRSFAEIAAELSVSEEASRKRVARALEQVRTRLARRGITTTSGALAAALTAAPAMAVPAHLAPSIAAAATTAAVTGGSWATGLFTFMSTLKLSGATVAAYSLLGAATLGTAMFVSLSRQQERELAQFGALQTQSAAFQQRLTQLKAEADVKSRRTGVQGAATAAAPAASTAELAAERARRERLLVTSPEYAPYRQQELRLRVQREFGPFFAQRGYSAEKIATLTQAFTLLIDGEQKARLARNAASPSATFRPDPTLVAESKTVEDEVRRYLGETEAEALRRYFLGQDNRPGAREFALDLADVGHPLTRAQERAIAATMGESRDARSNPDFPAMRRQGTPGADGLTPLDHWQIQRARGYLSPEQCARFEDYLRENRTRVALSVRAYESIGPDSPSR